jgi:dCMP deaminase
MQRLDWNTYFINIANEVKKRSPDPCRKVGSVLVSKTNRILSTGYNSSPAGIPSKEVDWTDRDFVHSIVIHAETNAILYAESKFESSKMYITTSPCKDCIKNIAAAGVKKVFYREEYKDIEKVKTLCLFFDIELVKL